MMVEQGAASHGAALAGLRVIDLTRVLGGPYCTQILGDHGADVIKIEPPQGDETRDWGPPFNADADVLVENFKPGAMERWGLGFEDVLSKRFPRLIHARVSGFGADGPMGGFPGYDAVIQAMAGHFSVNGKPEGGPTRIGIPFVDIGTGLYTAVAILMAVIERQRSGLGQFIDMTLFDCGVAIMHPHIANQMWGGKLPGLTGNAHPNICPYDTFQTATVPIFIAVGNDRAFARLCAEIGTPDLAADPRYAHNKDRLAHREALTADLAAALGKVDGQAVCETLLKAGVPAGPVLNTAQVMEHPHTIHRGMRVEDQGYRGFGIPIKFSRSKGGVRRGPPSFAAERDAILAEAGYSAAEIAAMETDGVAPATRRR